LRPSTRAPVAPGTRFIDHDPISGLGWELPDALREGALTGADGAQLDDLGVGILGTRGARHGILGPISPHRAWARLAQG
jgi:hypothetical protein